MSGAWTEDGPISLPSRPLAYGAGLAVVAFAVMGAGLGFQASFRKSAGPEASAARASGADDAIAARPVVDLSPTTSAPIAEKKSADEPDTHDADDDSQTVPSDSTQPAQVTATPDATDKTVAPVKAPDEAPPAPPTKSEVPF